MTSLLRRFFTTLFLLECAASWGIEKPAGVIAEGTPQATPYFVQDSGVAGPTVMIVGGMHGDEPAGVASADEIRQWPVARGKLMVVPRANVAALEAAKLFAGGAVTDSTKTDPAKPKPVKPDLASLDLKFPVTGGPDKVAGEVAAALWTLVQQQKPAWLVDLQEVAGDRTEGSKNGGNSLIVFPAPDTEEAVTVMLTAVNTSTTNRQDLFLQVGGPASGSLALAAGERLGAHAMIVETTMKSQPLSKRVRQQRVMMHALLKHLGMIDPSVTPERIMARTKAPGQVFVALYDAGGSFGAGVPRVSEQLGREANVQFACVGPEDIRGGVLSQFDVVIFTGGSGSKQAAALDTSGRAQVKQFVENGGGFIGICAGAYLPCEGFSWGVKILDAKTKSSKWQRGKGTVKLELTDEGRAVFGDVKGTFDCRYAQGPILMPAQAEGIPDYETLAFFRTELAENDTPKGIMVDSPAIVAGRYGKGRLIAISPHPEQTAGLEQFIPRAVARVAP